MRIGRHSYAAVIAVIAVLGLGLSTEHFTGDIVLTQLLNTMKTGAWGAIVDGIYFYLEPAYAVALSLILAASVGLVQRSIPRALAFGMTIALTWVPIVLLKVLFHRPRPLPQLLAHPMALEPRDWSFPSGYTAFVTAVAMALVLVSATEMGKKITRFLAPVLIVSISVCVLTLGVHFPTDVIGSVIWSLGLAPLMWALSLRMVKRVCQAGTHVREQSQLHRGPSSSVDSARKYRLSLLDHRGQKLHSKAVHG